MVIGFVELIPFVMADVDRVFGICRCLHTENSASAAWVIYMPTGQVLSSGGVCLWPSSNNIVEYSVVIELLCDAISHGIWSLEVCIESQLVVLQLNGMYHIRD